MVFMNSKSLRGCLVLVARTGAVVRVPSPEVYEVSMRRGKAVIWWAWGSEAGGEQGDFYEF